MDVRRHLFAIVAIMLAWIGSQSTSVAQQNVHLYWVDRGINSHDNNTSAMVQRFGECTAAVNCIWLPAPTNVMSEDEWQRWTKDNAESVRQAATTMSRSGAKAIEILSAQNVDTLDHFYDGEREQQAERYTNAVGTIVDDVKRTTGADVTGVFGSNGSRTFTEAGWRLAGSNLHPVDHAILVTGRAHPFDTSLTCSIGPDCTILVSQGDYPSIDRIGNTAVAQTVADGDYLIKQEFGDSVGVGGNARLIYIDREGFQFGWPRPNMSSHVASMNKEENIRVREYLGNGNWTAWYPMTDSDLLTESARPKSESVIVAWDRNQAAMAREVRERSGEVVFEPPAPGTPEYEAWKANESTVAAETLGVGGRQLGQELAKTEAAMNAYLTDRAAKSQAAADAQRERERKLAEQEERANDPSRPSTFDQIMAALNAASTIYQSVQSAKAASNAGKPSTSPPAPPGMCLNPAAQAADKRWMQDFQRGNFAGAVTDIRTPDGHYIPWFIPCPKK